MKHFKYLALALVVGTGAFVAYRATRPAPPKIVKPTIVDLARQDRREIDVRPGKEKTQEAYRGFVKKWKDSPDKKIQDEVGAARIRLAYLQGKEKDYQGARATLKQAVTEYKGSGSMASDFGGIKDQAQYQAAVCLNLEGKTQEYRAALVEFIKTQPLSPLVNAAYKRIVKLDGKSTPESDRLLQNALDIQQKKIRFETSVCGPKAVAYLLKHEGKGDFDYKQLAKESGMTDKGTTVEGLRQCLKSHGLAYFGFQVVQADLPKIDLPAIYYSGDHYLVVTKIDAESMTAYDPMYDREERIPLSQFSDSQSAAILLLKSAPKTETH